MSGDNDITALIIDSATRIFRQHGAPQDINNASGDSWRQNLWTALEESGLTLVWSDEDKGGAGAGLSAGFDVLKLSGRFAVAVPLAETMLAAWALAEAGIALPAGPMTVAPAGFRQTITLQGNGALAGTARNIPFAGEAGHIVVVAQSDDGPAIALVEAGHCAVTPGTSIAGDDAGTVSFDGVTPAATAPAPGGWDDDTLMLMGATVRARQMAGALQTVLDLAVDYAQERIAFGRPIGKFQAVQQNLARLAGEVAAADAASGSAADAYGLSGDFDEGVFLEFASAKIRCGEAAGETAAIAHQVFGAIGFTQEHVLQRFTRRLWAWRDEFGSESEWAELLGRRVAAAGADELWPMLAAR